MAKHEYTKKFDAFWEAYPRRTAKLPAFKAWIKNGIEDDAFLPTQIIQDLEKRTRFKWWPKDQSKIPHAATWINQARWEDEGWEEEIKTREDGPVNTGKADYEPIEEEDYGLDRWQMMLNRLMRSYVLLHGHLSPAGLDALVRTKNDVHKELINAVTEEIDSADDKRAKKAEMAFLFADTMLNRFDQITGKAFRGRVIDMSKQNRRAA